MHWSLFLFFVLTGDASAQVYRCGNTYTHDLCANGREVDVSPALTDPRGPATKIIYLCRASNGGAYWLDEGCHVRGWTVERTARVPVDVSWSDQVAEGRRQKGEAESNLVAPPSVVRRVQRSNVKAKCAALDERVKALDSMGRAGSRYYDLNWVRQERKKARDTQFRIRC